ncbi:BIRC2_3 [Mytilus edulis]|uniref:BIRC2_3 n=1 Tax=Mytilus edulis TaxID=6550 RepID=A0A8S3VJ28_MYTED|nr:BIRC2_3 [Mytilus edulis]
MFIESCIQSHNCLTRRNNLILHNRMGYDEIPQHPLERLRPMRENYELRMNTFQQWSNQNVSPKELCDDGFYYMGSPDMVQCAFCGGVLSGWRPDDDVHKLHAVNFGQCRKVCKYANYEERLASFRNWPSNLSLCPIDLASAGLYYTGKRDICKCFMCDGCVCDWEAGDVPSKEHTRIYPDCPLSQIKA